MKSYPLKSITIEEATIKQFELVDAITHEFHGIDFLSLGDLGVVSPLNQPTYTRQVEKVLARFFHSEDAVLVRGAGTAAIKESLLACIEPGSTILVHTSPIYETTQVTFKHSCFKTIQVDFHDANAIKSILNQEKIDAVLIQYSRQSLEDHYDIKEVIQIIKENTEIPIITDDNYVVMKVNQIGYECGASASAFSLFKLLGPPGIGCVIGTKAIVEKIRKSHYSGGSQVQGFEAMDALRSLVYAPVSLAIQAMQVDQISNRLNQGEISGVKHAYVVNAQSKVIVVELEKPIAKKILEITNTMGAAPHPVGAESRYEVIPMFYRVSKTMTESFTNAENILIRINPMRSGADTVIRILQEAIKKVN